MSIVNQNVNVGKTKIQEMSSTQEPTIKVDPFHTVLSSVTFSPVWRSDVALKIFHRSKLLFTILTLVVSFA